MSAYEGPAIVELMGHRRLAGTVSEVEQYGGKFLRIDVPAVGDLPAFTQFYGASAVYGVSPTTMEIVERLTAQSRPVPVSRYDLALPPAPVVQDGESPDDDPTY